MGFPENRGPEYSTPNSRILILRTPNIRYPLIFGNSHVVLLLLGEVVTPFNVEWLRSLVLRGNVYPGAYEALMLRGSSLAWSMTA